jgi:hypothetical protein
MDRGNPSARRGFVNFPTADPAYKHTGEGGLFVRLVVIPNPDSDFMVCQGGEIRFLSSGILVGDDITAIPAKPASPEKEQAGVGGLIGRLRSVFSKPDLSKAWQDYYDKLERRKTFLTDVYFAQTVKTGDFRTEEKPVSIDLLAAVTLGSTGWAGYNEDEGLYWRCRFTDLTPEGQALYNTMKNLYGESGYLALQTWLDR